MQAGRAFQAETTLNQLNQLDNELMNLKCGIKHNVKTSNYILTNMVMNRDEKIKILEAKINELKKIVSEL